MALIDQIGGPLPGVPAGEVIGALGLHGPAEFVVAPHPVEVDGDTFNWPGDVFAHTPVLGGLDRVTNGRHTFQTYREGELRVATFGTARKDSVTRLVQAEDEVFGTVVRSPGTEPEPLGEVDATDICHWLHECLQHPPTHLGMQARVVTTLLNTHLGRITD